MNGNKRLGVVSKDKLEPFPTHDELKSSLKVLKKTRHSCF